MSEALLSVLILTPCGVVYEGECEEAYFPSSTGLLGILPNHTPYVASLAARGVISLRVGSSELFFAVWSGALEVKPEKTIVLTERCEKASSREAAEGLLSKVPASSPKQNEDVRKAEVAITNSLSSQKISRRERIRFTEK